jgi:SAM-dependent methyltransferase
VIGVGGGRDVLSQRLFGLRDVTGVEINPIIIDVLERQFSGYTAIAALDGVRFEVDEARSWFARTRRSFDVIQMSLIDTWAATGAGAFTLRENGLYTVEAWQRFLGRLNPGGLFTVSRWYAPGEVNETGRLVSLGVASLLANGAADPRRHLFLAAAGNVATLIVTESPLSPAALGALKDAAKANEFTVLLSPDTVAPSTILEKIVSVLRTVARSIRRRPASISTSRRRPTRAPSSSISWGSPPCSTRTYSRISLTPECSPETSSRR